jgi:predicted transcriptional regulator
MTDPTPTTADYLDRLLQESIRTDRRLRYDADIADAIGVSRSTVSQYRKGKNMSVYVAVRLAFLLDVDPMETVSATMARQAQNDQERDFWTQLYKQYKPL